MATPLMNASEATQNFLNIHFQKPEDISNARILLKKLTDEKESLEKEKKCLSESILSQIQESKTEIQDFINSLGSLSEKLDRSFLESSGNLKTIDPVVNELSSITSEINLIYKSKQYLEKVTQLENVLIELEDSVSSALPDRLLYTGKPSNRISKIDSELLIASVHSFRSASECAAEIARSNAQWRHLITAVDVKLDQISSILKPALIASFKSSLSSLPWPPPLSFSSNAESESKSDNQIELNPFESNLNEFSNCFTSLAVFQVMENKRKQRIQHSQFSVSKPLPSEPPSLLWCVSELFRPIVTKTEQHFINWLERPDLTLNLIHQIARKCIHPIEIHLQPLIDDCHLPECYLTEECVRVLSVCASDQLKHKIFPHLMNKLHQHHHQHHRHGDDDGDVLFHDTVFRSLWMNTIDEIISFDKKMLSLSSHGLSFKVIKVNSDPNTSVDFDFDSDVVPNMLTWNESRVLGRDIPPCIDVLCSHDDWFEIWTGVELYEAKNRLMHVLNNDGDDESAWTIQLSKNPVQSFQSQPWIMDNDDEVAISHTNGANVVIDISNELIDRCRSLTGVLLRSRFVQSTVFELIRFYVSECLRRCREIEAKSSLSSSDNIKKVCFVLNDCYYLDFEFRKWEDEIFFIEIQKQEREKNDEGEGGEEEGGESHVRNRYDVDEGWMGIDVGEDELDVKIENEKDEKCEKDEKDEKDNMDGMDDENYSFFDSLIMECRSLREEWTVKIVSSLCRQFSSHCFDYFRDRKRWSTFELTVEKSTLASTQGVRRAGTGEEGGEEEEGEERVDEKEFMNAENSYPANIKQNQESNSIKQIHGSHSFTLLNAISIVQDELDSIHQIVSFEVFFKILKKLMAAMDEMVLEKIVFNGVKFSLLGIQNFALDMDALFSIFSKYMASPMSCFRGVCDVLALLKLSSSIASPLLQQLNLVKFSLFEKERKKEREDEFGHVLNSDALKGLGIEKLDVQRVRKVLRSRLDLIIST